jgi:hypothetical protein
VASIDNFSTASQWLTYQLSRPLDISEEHTIIYGLEDLAKEVDSAEGIEEYAKLFRVLAWREKRHRGKTLELELAEISRLKTRFNHRVTSREAVLPKTDGNVSDLWERILNALSLPSTRQLLSQQAILVYADSRKAVIHVASNWFAMVQSRLGHLERAAATATGGTLKIELEPKEFPVLDKVIEAIQGAPSTSHRVIISLYDPSEDKGKILSNINVCEEDEDDINLLIKAWTHHGGRLEDLSGIPAYLQDR